MEKINRKYGLYLHSLSIAFWIFLIACNVKRLDEPGSLHIVGLITGTLLLAASALNLVTWFRKRKKA
jgi:hypothetical protein